MAVFKIKDSRFVNVGSVKVEFNHKGFFETEDKELIKGLKALGFEEVKESK